MQKSNFSFTNTYSTDIQLKKGTESCIELSTTNASVGTSIEFHSCTENALSLEWYIEGSEAAPENALGWSDITFTHAFSLEGTYIVTLNAYEKFSFLGERSMVTEKVITN